MTSYNYSYNVLINRLEAFAAGHFLIKRFTHGQIDMSDQLQDDQYPFMHVTPDTITPVQGGMQFGFHIMFADIPRDKEYKAEYQREVISDCIRLGQDLIAEVKNGLELFGFDVQLVNDVTFEPFMEEQKNTVTGVAFTIQLEVPWDWSACDIPAIWSVGGAGGSGGSGTGYGVTLQTNGVDNVVQNLLNLEEGNNITIVDNGNGTITINSTGGGGSGTVTSVALTAPAAFNVSGSPITGAGTLALSAAGNSSQYIDGAGNLQSFPSLSQTLQQVTTAGNETTESIITENVFGFQVQTSINQVLADLKPDASTTEGILTLYSNTGFYSPTIYKRVGINNILFPTSGTGTFALSVNGNTPNPVTGDITISAGSGTVTSVGTTGLISGGPITTSGTITTSMNTAKLVGRYSAGTGIMEEITVGSGLTLTGAGVLNNTATPTPTGYYGAFQDNTTQTAVSANTAYAVKLNTTDLTNGVSVVNDGSGNPTRITLANTGIYNIQFSLQLEKTGGSGNFIVDVWVRKNGVDIPNTTGKVVLTGSANASPIVAAWNYVLDLSANDYVQLMWSTSNNNAIILAATATSPHPGIPSAILTVTQQAGIMAGTGITAINSLTGAAQSLVVGTGGTDFAVTSSGTTHTFNLPTASAANRGALSSADWSTFNGKQNSIGLTTVGNNLATLPNPSAVRYLKINADNSVSAISLATLRSDIGMSTFTFKTADHNTTATAFADVPELNFAVTAGVSYSFKFVCLFSAALVTTGSRWGVNGPASPTRLIYRVLFPASTTGLVANGAYTLYDQPTATVSSAAPNNNCALVEGVITPSANGTVSLRFATEIAGSQIQCQINSYLELKVI